MRSDEQVLALAAAATATRSPEKGEAPTPARVEASESENLVGNPDNAPGTIRTCGLWLRSAGASADGSVATPSDASSFSAEEFDGLLVDAGKRDELAQLTGATWESVQVCTESAGRGDDGCGECLRCALLALAGTSRNLLASNCRFGEQCELAATLEHAEEVLHG